MNKKAIAYDVITYYHLSGCLLLAEKNNIDSLVVKLLPNMNGEYNIQEKEFFFHGCNVVLIRQKPIKRTFLKSFVNLFAFAFSFFFVRKKCYFLLHHSYFKPTGLAYFSFKQCLTLSALAFEEGLGTYGNMLHHIEVSRREGKRFPRVSFFLKKALSLFAYKDGFLIDSDKNKVKFKSINKFIYKEFFLESYIGDEAELDTVLLIGSPWVGLLGYDKSFLSNLYYSIDTRFPNLCVYIKPHPLDTYSGYEEIGFKVLDKSVPAEVLLCNKSYNYVLSGRSTVSESIEKYFDYRADKSTSLIDYDLVSFKCQKKIK